MNKWKEEDVQGIKFIGKRMAKQDVRTFLAQLVDEIKMVELPENPEERNGTWSTVQEMTRNWTYTGKLSAKIKEKYEKHTRAMKVWQPLHDRMHASQRHLRKLNEDIKEPGNTKYWPKRYQIPELTKLWKAKQQEGQLKTNIEKTKTRILDNKNKTGPYLQTRKENSSPGE